MKFEITLNVMIEIPDLSISSFQSLTRKNMQEILYDIKSQIKDFFPVNSIVVRDSYNIDKSGCCQYCGKIFSSKRALKAHINNNPECRKKLEEEKKRLNNFYLWSQFVSNEKYRFVYIRLDYEVEERKTSKSLVSFKFDKESNRLLEIK
ncbi:hypothetical protein ES708_09322 [subsurface metagenome]